MSPPWEGLAERRSSRGRDGRREARTQVAFVLKSNTGATEDAASRRSSAALRLSRCFVKPS
jgi:hypothetical protein